MRARNVKPGLFSNEILGDADPLITILFVGLWCAADREGRLEDRPLRLCGQLFPYRRSVTGEHVDQMLGWLDERGFVKRYTVSGRRIIQILEFGRHQSPHSNESASKLPPMPTTAEQTSNHGQKPVDPSSAARRSDSLIPDSGFSDSGLLITDSGNVRTDEPDGPSESMKRLEISETERRESWQRCKAKFPPFSGKQDWISAEKAASLLVSNGHATWDFLEQHVELYHAYCVTTRIAGTQYVMRPGKYFSDIERPWAQEWTPPQDAPPADDRNQRELQKFLKGTG
jgi:hypothetical protein